MNIIKKKQSWRKFSLKVAILLTVMAVGSTYFMSRYRIGIDEQVIKCIPGYTWYLIDKQDKQVMRDNLYVFHAKGMEPFHKTGSQIVKYVRGMPGDKVSVTQDLKVKVNESILFEGLPLATSMGIPAKKFVGNGQLNQGQYWFFGTSPLSFDSRYWGAVNEDQIIGRAYPLF